MLSSPILEELGSLVNLQSLVFYLPIAIALRSRIELRNLYLACSHEQTHRPDTAGARVASEAHQSAPLCWWARATRLILQEDIPTVVVDRLRSVRCPIEG